MICKVTLNQKEFAYAESVGKTRQEEAVKSGRHDAHGYSGDGFNIHVQGACGELALAQALGWHWSAPVNTYKSGGDVGILQVRTAVRFLRSGKDTSLIIRPDDNDDDIFVLVWMIDKHNYEIAGYIKGVDAKQRKWWRPNPSNGRPPLYLIDRAGLKDVEDLKLLCPPPA